MPKKIAPTTAPEKPVVHPNSSPAIQGGDVHYRDRYGVAGSTTSNKIPLSEHPAYNGNPGPQEYSPANPNGVDYKPDFYPKKRGFIVGAPLDPVQQPLPKKSK